MSIVTVIGDKGCARCEMVKRLLTEKGIEFEYKMIDDMPDKQTLLERCASEGIGSYPILIKDGIIFTNVDGLM